jgi:hypothetical protein
MVAFCEASAANVGYDAERMTETVGTNLGTLFVEEAL